MGIAHILSGPDHILFVLGLILAGGSFRRLLGIVSAFTLAHSITLSLTALDIASLSPRIVEPMIAFSILVVRIQNLLSRNPPFHLPPPTPPLEGTHHATSPLSSSPRPRPSHSAGRSHLVPATPSHGTAGNLVAGVLRPLHEPRNFLHHRSIHMPRLRILRRQTLPLP